MTATDLPPQPRGWTRWDRIAFWGVTIVAALLRLVRLGDPPKIMFDEVYYAKDSCWYVLANASACQLEGPQAEVHPPLAKWLMALGIRVFGFDAFGWRIVAALAGVATVAVMFVLARRLLRSTIGATLAAGLLAFDFLHFVQSRIAMLEIFVPLFGLLALLFVVLDRDALWAARAQEPGEEPADDEAAPARRRRPWRLAAGVACGAALASKWSGALVVGAVALLALVWEVSARPEESLATRARRAFREQGLAFVGYFVILPLLVYLLSFVGRIHGELLALPWSEDAWLNNLWDHHRYMGSYHAGLDASHPYESPAWSWLLLRRPVAYFFETPGGAYSEVLATGNPFVWWMSLVAVAGALVSLVLHRSARRPELVVVAGFVLTYVPWFVLTRGREAVFLFYVLPTVPFMCLALAWAAASIERSWEGKATIGIFAAATVALFVFYYPVLAKVPIPKESWDRRIWIFGEGCERPPHEEGENPPPVGWCWI